MELGVLIFPTDLSIRPAELAAEVEERGFGSLFVTEHTHIPTNHSPWPGGAPLPDEYRRTLDPFVALAAASAVTSRIKLGTGICLVPQHDPIVLAKEVASLDLVSGGRFVFGIGVGWNIPELEHHGVDPKKRFAITREKVLAMKELWTKDEASYSGQYVRFGPSWSWPKPVQQPGPPIWMGGSLRDVTLRSIAEYADAWMPIHGRNSIADQIPTLRAAVADAGRDPDSVEVHIFGCPPKPSVIDSYAEAGVRSCILGLPPAPSDTVRRVLDGYQALLSR